MSSERPPNRSSGEQARGRRQSFGRRSSGSLDDLVQQPKEGASRRKSMGQKEEEPEVDPEEEKKKAAASQQARNQRRSFTLQRFAMNDGMNDMLGDMSNELVHGVEPNATAKKKMQAVMINAKERGMTVAQIFKLFLDRGSQEGGDGEPPKISEDDLDVELTPEDFGAALKKLGGRLFNVPETELKALIEDFDEDKNGTISMIEFRNWCYHIPHLAWKAERLRFEKGDDGSGNASVASHGSSTRRANKPSASQGASPVKATAATGPFNAKVTEVYKGTKLFWHTREKIEIVLSESKPLNSIIVSTMNETAKKVGALIFVDLSVASSLIDGEAFSNAKVKAIERAEKEANAKAKGQANKKLDMGEKAEIEDRVRREMLANLVLLRLKLVDGQATIQTLDSDKPDVQSGFLLPGDPGVPKNDLPQFEVYEAVDFKAAQRSLDEMSELAGGLSALTASSDRAATGLRRSLDAIERLKEMSKSTRKIDGSAAKQRFYWAMRRLIVRNEVDRVRAHVGKSPTYHALLTEQAAKGNTESMEIIKTLKASGSMP